MSYWIVDRLLPGVVAGVIASSLIGAFMWVDRRLIKRHIDRAAERQNAHFDQMTAEQTAALSGRPKTPGGSS
jgi:uncharacterized membrane protein YciS (DUF1049 family)